MSVWVKKREERNREQNNTHSHTLSNSLKYLEAKMQTCLDRLGLPLKVLWLTEVTNAKHGEIRSNCILIYDRDETDAWLTFEQSLRVHV